MTSPTARDMNISAPFIARPVATTLLTIGIALAGIFAFFKLPVSPLPQVDFPTISVQAQLPGASPDTVATSVASAAGASSRADRRRHRDDLDQFGRSGADRAAVRPGPRHQRRGARRAGGDQRRAGRPADQPAQQSDLSQGQPGRRADPDPGADLEDADPRPDVRCRDQCPVADAVADQRHRSGDHRRRGAARRCASSSIRNALFKYGIGLEDVRAALASANANSPKGAIETAALHYQLYTNDQATHAADYQPLVIAYRNGAAVRLSDVADVQDSVENLRNAGLAERQAGGAGDPVPPARRQHHRHRRQREGGDPAADGGDAERHRPDDRQRPQHRRSAPVCTTPR